ncbi:MAG: Lrp/AsnC family transcriptional regulator [Candidatus Staskawiczbacteria bacterium]
MWFTKHEKEVLKLLLENGKLSDTAMAEKLKISTQAIGRIRKRLEEDVIKRYSIELDPKVLGLNIISITKVKVEGILSKEIELLEKIMINELKNISILKTICGEGKYIIMAEFKDLDELNTTIENYKKQISQQYPHVSYNLIETIILPLHSLLKDSHLELYKKMIDSCGVKHIEMKKEF